MPHSFVFLFTLFEAACISKTKSLRINSLPVLFHKQSCSHLDCSRVPIFKCSRNISTRPLNRHEDMRVHPSPRKRNITFRYDVNSSLSEASEVFSTSSIACGSQQKKLRRLPHIFSKVLELPFHSDADVSIEEDSECFRFSVTTDDIGDDVHAHIIRVHPGITKVIIRSSNVVEFSLNDLPLDLWRFRLPSSTRPELATADYADGELMVTIPKGTIVPDDDGNALVNQQGEGSGDLSSNFGQLVLVQ